MKVRLYGCPLRVRATTTFPRVGGGRAYTFNDSVHNAQLAVAMRLLSAEREGRWHRIDQLRPPPGHSKCLDDWYSGLEKMAHPTTPVDLLAFYRLYAGARKRAVYKKAAESLVVSPLCYKDSRIKGFLKYEKQLGGLGKVPRAIMPPDPRYLVQTGVYIHPVEEQIYRNVDSMFGWRAVAKGLTYEGVGRLFQEHWGAFDDPVAVDLDVEKMDRSTTAEVNTESHRPILAAYPEGSIREWLLWQTVNSGVIRASDGHVSYAVEGTLSSGQMNTSLVGILTVCGMMWSFARSSGLDFRIVDAGDDCTAIMERRSVARFQDGVKKFMRKIGYEITMSPVRENIEEIEFCQAHPVWVKDAYRMVRIPKDALKKDATWLSPVRSKRAAAQWLKAVADCGLASHSGVPVQEEFYRAYRRISNGWKNDLGLTPRSTRRFDETSKRMLEDGGLKFWSKGMVEENIPITDRTRVSYYRAFGFTPSFQVGLESYYRGLNFDYELAEERYYLPNMVLAALE